jgi:sugar phosphate isomerase/epimerase
MEQFPKLHNALWPGVVGKQPNTENPPIPLEVMLDLTAQANVNGVRFDGVDLLLAAPHTPIDATANDLRALADAVAARQLEVGSLVAPVWGSLGGGSAMGSLAERSNFLLQVRRACQIGAHLRELGVRRHGVIRIDSACSPSDWAANPADSQARIAETFREACAIAADFGEKLAAEGEICWGGMHSWQVMVELLERVGRPEVLGFQADMAHTLLYALGHNALDDRLVPHDFDWSDQDTLDAALKTLTKHLRPWTIDFHVAQNDGSVFGSGSHDKTGRHCQVDDPNGKLSLTRHAGYWLRDEQNNRTPALRHICWDGCMFPNPVLENPQTWNRVLAAMIEIRAAHGWSE